MTVCTVCGSLEFRVPGQRCPKCNLRHRSEPPLHATDFAVVRSGPTYPAPIPLFSRGDIAAISARMDQVINYKRRPVHSGEDGKTDVCNPFFKDELGKRYGTFQVIARVPNVAGQARWVLRCDDCGAELRITGSSLRYGARHGRTVKCVVCAKAKVRTA